MNTEEKAKHLYNLFGKDLGLEVVNEILESMPKDYNVYKEDGTNFINAYNYYWTQVGYYLKSIS